MRAFVLFIICLTFLAIAGAVIGITFQLIALYLFGSTLPGMVFGIPASLAFGYFMAEPLNRFVERFS